MALDADAISKLNKCLRSAFPSASPIDSADYVGSGVNAETHIWVQTLNGEIYGFKRWIKATAHGDREAACAERDLLINKLAGLLKAPNACPVRQICDLDIGEFEGKIVAVTRWLPRSVSIDRMQDGSLKEIQEQGEIFFHQYGQWLAFGNAMGCRDWTENNFVWSEAHHALAMIDMDWCFMTKSELLARGLPQHGHQRPLTRLVGIAPDKLERYMKLLSKGMDKMDEEISFRLAPITQLIERAQHKEIREFKPSIDSGFKNSVIETITGLLARTTAG